VRILERRNQPKRSMQRHCEKKNRCGEAHATVDLGAGKSGEYGDGIRGQKWHLDVMV